MQSTLNETYIITEHTYLLESRLQNNKFFTLITDRDGKHEIPKSVTRIIRSSCRQSGISLERMRMTSKNNIQPGVHKLPLILAFKGNHPQAFFPLYSPRSPGNVWTNINAIINIESEQKNTVVTFLNDERVTLPVQYQTFCGLYVRAYFYQRHLDEMHAKRSRKKSFIFV